MIERDKVTRDPRPVYGKLYRCSFTKMSISINSSSRAAVWRERQNVPTPTVPLDTEPFPGHTEEVAQLQKSSTTLVHGISPLNQTTCQIPIPKCVEHINIHKAVTVLFILIISL